MLKGHCSIMKLCFKLLYFLNIGTILTLPLAQNVQDYITFGKYIAISDFNSLNILPIRIMLSSITFLLSAVLIIFYFIQIAAENIREFLRKASVESDKLRAAAPIANIPNGTCLTEYKRIKCKTFVSTCSGSSNITKESCEQKLQWQEY